MCKNPHYRRPGNRVERAGDEGCARGKWHKKPHYSSLQIAAPEHCSHKSHVMKILSSRYKKPHYREPGNREGGEARRRMLRARKMAQKSALQLPALDGVADVLLGGDEDGEHDDERAGVVVVEAVDKVVVDARLERLQRGGEELHLDERGQPEVRSLIGYPYTRNFLI